MIQKKRLGDILIECQLLTEEQLKQALDYGKQNGIRVGESLQVLEIVSEKDIQWAIADQLGISQIELRPEMVSEDALALAGMDFLKEKMMIPMMVMGEMVSVAMVDPLDEWAREDFVKLTGMEPSLSICAKKDFLDTWNFFQNKLAGPSDSAESPKIKKGQASPSAGGRAYAEKLLHYILKEAVVRKSDKIHLHPYGENFKLVFRQGNSLDEKAEIDRVTFDQLEDLFRGRCRFSEENPRRGFFKIKAGESLVDFQVLFFQALKGRGLTLSCEWEEGFSLDSFGFSDDTLLEMGMCLESEEGLVMLGGDISSPSERLAYTLLSELSNHGRKVVTFEAPIYREMKSWLQFPCHNEEEVFKAGKEFLDIDGDVFYFTPCFSEKFKEHLTYWASSRKLLFARSWIKNSLGFLQYLNGYSQSLNSSRIFNIKAFITVIEVPKMCENCKEIHPSDKERASRLGGGSEFGFLTSMENFYRARGCEKCQHSGRQGTQFLTEILRLTPGIQNSLVMGLTPELLKNYLPERTLQDQAREKLEKGEISLPDYLGAL